MNDAGEKPLKILWIEDSEDDVELVRVLLRNASYETTVRRVETAEALNDALTEGAWDLVIGDYTMPNFSGLKALEIVRARGVDAPFIFVSGTMGEEVAVKALKAGAQDYIVKGNFARLVPAIERELNDAKRRKDHAHAEGERRRIEEQLRQSQKMEAIGQLTGGIAHDFNNLLTVIFGNLQLIEEGLNPDSELHRWAERATEAATHGAQLTNQLLAFSRQQVLNPRVVDLGETIRGLMDFLQRTIGASIVIETEFDPDAGKVRLDTALLSTSLLNLGINAHDAMAGSGTLRIRTGRMALDEAEAARYPGVAPGEFVYLEVTDTGKGIPPQSMERIFEPFFTTKDEGKGTGLGLSMVYGFVGQSGGFIRVESEVDKGTTFVLHFPRANSAEISPSAPSPATARPRARGTESILVVEDTDSVRDIAVTLLRELGYRVIEAATGPEALDLIDGGETCDLLFTDVMMVGGMNGPALADAVLERLPSVKVLFTSGFAESGLLGRTGEDRELHVLNKPYRFAALAQKVRELLDDR